MTLQKLNKTQQQALLASQLFVLAALESIKGSNELNDASKKACSDAEATAFATVDLLATTPALKRKAQRILETFGNVEVANG